MLRAEFRAGNKLATNQDYHALYARFASRIESVAKRPINSLHKLTIYKLAWNHHQHNTKGSRR